MSLSGEQEQAIEERVRAIIAQECQLDPARVTRDATLSDLSISSVDMVQLMFLIEEEFDIYLSNDESGFQVENVGSVFDIVKKLVAEKSPATA